MRTDAATTGTSFAAADALFAQARTRVQQGEYEQAFACYVQAADADHPASMIEAARMDGSGEFRTFIRIVLPLCTPALAVVAIFSVMWRWSDFLWPLVVAQSEAVYTLPVALARFNAEETVPFNLILAMGVVSTIPVLIIFLIFQKQIATGIANTGGK